MRVTGACVVLLVSMVHALPAAAQTVPTEFHAVPVRRAEAAPLKRAARQASVLSLPAAQSRPLRARRQRATTHGWIGRHPALFGAAVGFWAGFFIGYVPGDDGVFDDFTATFNGMVMGGIGAGVGAATGAIISAAGK